MQVQKIHVKQQANGYWRWRALGKGTTRLGNSSKSFSNLGDCVDTLMAVTDAKRRKLPVVVQKKNETRAVAMKL